MANRPTVGGCSDIGGIVGFTTGSVSYSYNRGNVSSAGGQKVGGIVGNANTSGSVSYSYNVGTIGGSYALGGIVGYGDTSTPSVTYCYSSKGPSGGSSYGALVGYYNGTVTNSYYLSGLTSSKGSAQAAYYMKVYLPSINSSFVADGSDGNALKNGGYPRLSWECTPAKGVICYSVSGSLATATVSSGQATFVSSGSGNSAYIYMPVYTYRNTYNITAVANKAGTTGSAYWYRNGSTSVKIVSSSTAGTSGTYSLSNGSGSDMGQGRFYFSGAVQFMINGSVTKLVKL